MQLGNSNNLKLYTISLSLNPILTVTLNGEVAWDHRQNSPMHMAYEEIKFSQGPYAVILKRWKRSFTIYDTLLRFI